MSFNAIKLSCVYQSIVCAMADGTVETSLMRVTAVMSLFNTL